jgi:hypothetical protein
VNQPAASGMISIANHSSRSMLSEIDCPRQSKISSCAPIDEGTDASATHVFHVARL